MSTIECNREQELIDVVQSGRWPARCPEELRAHIAQCSICADTTEVALALHEDREDAWPEARVPSAGLVWWRAELRARQEAMRTVSRPMNFIQAVSGVCAAGAGIALLIRAWPWMKGAFALPDLSSLSAFSLDPWALPLAFAVALLIVAPLATYLALSDK